MIVTIAAGPYAHTAALTTEGTADEIQLRYEPLEPAQIFQRMQRDSCWDVAEMSLATIYMMADRGDERFVPLPVFPSRAFRHSAVYLPVHSKVRTARDLHDATLGVLRYSMTTAVYVRAFLARQYGLRTETLRWVVGDDSPHPVVVEPRVVEGAAELERMAVAGEIDCLISGRTPIAFLSGKLRRLFPDFGAEEKASFADTRIFPIMHAMVARRELVDEHPEVIPILIKRFDYAKRRAEENLRNLDFSVYPLPWLGAYVEDATRQIGRELWPYGIEPNRRTLSDFGRMLAAEGLTSRTLAPQDVFELT